MQNERVESAFNNFCDLLAMGIEYRVDVYR